MFFEKTSGDPLINCVSYIFYEFNNSSLILLYCSFNSFKEEFYERLQRILIHVIDDT